MDLRWDDVLFEIFKKGCCMIIQGLTVFIGLTSSNFAWQYVNNHDWMVAAERSYFQLMAIGALVFIHLTKKCR